MNRMAHGPFRRDESGAVLIISVILIVVLLGTAAVVVDLGLANSERRKMQSAADTSALGAAQGLPDLPTSDAQAQGLAAANMPDSTLGWASCTDAGHLAVVSAASQCISYDGSFTRIRVRIPRQTFSTIFGGILGFSNVSTSTVAVAQIRPIGPSGLLPFVLFGGFGGTGACVDVGGGGPNRTCGKPTGWTGFFGDLDMLQYGNTLLGTDTITQSQRCGSGNSDHRLTGNVAMGADHLYTDDLNNNRAHVNDDCGPPPQAGPNMIGQGTGNGNAFDDGVLSAGPGDPDVTDGFGARLHRVPTTWPTCGVYPSTNNGFDGCWPTITAANHTGIDNRPLWSFVDKNLDGSPSVPAACWPSSYPNTITQAAAHLLMTACLDAYAVPGAPYPPLFTRDTGPQEQPLNILDIQSSPRFNYVPQVVDTDPGKSTCSNCLHIQTFRGVFLQEIMGNNPEAKGALDFEPGPWNVTDTSNKSAEGMIAFVIPDSALPLDLRGKPLSIGKNAIVQLVG
jgi:hypothetical protein